MKRMMKRMTKRMMKRMGLTTQFGYRYLLLKDLMKPKSAFPFLLDAHSL